MIALFAEELRIIAIIILGFFTEDLSELSQQKWFIDIDKEDKENEQTFEDRL